MNEYLEFLQNKQKTAIISGFDVDINNLNKSMFEFQKFIVQRALKAGKYAIFADCGLGKTLMQIEWAKQVNIKTDKPVLILAPLSVSGQTIKEGVKFGIEVLKYPLNGTLDLLGGIYITNYEQLDNIDFSIFSGIVFTPFMGIGSEVFQAVKMDRKAIGFELKESYFDLAKSNVNIALAEKNQSQLFV